MKEYFYLNLIHNLQQNTEVYNKAKKFHTFLKILLKNQTHYPK